MYIACLYSILIRKDYLGQKYVESKRCFYTLVFNSVSKRRRGILRYQKRRNLMLYSKRWKSQFCQKFAFMDSLLKRSHAGKCL